MPDAAINQAKRRQWLGIVLTMAGLALCTHLVFRHVRRDAIAFRAAESAYARKDYSTALRHYARAKAAGYSSLPMALHYGRCLLESGEAADSLNLLRPWLRGPGVPLELVVLALDAAQQSALPREGLAILAGLGPREQLRPSDLVRLADLHQQAGQMEEAIACVRLALGSVPDSADLNTLAGRYLATAGRYREAISALTLALQLEPSHRAARLALARTFAWDQRYPEAAASYRIYLGE